MIKQKMITPLVAGAILLVTVGIAVFENSKDTLAIEADTSKQTEVEQSGSDSTYKEPSLEDKVDLLLESMSIEEKIAQMLIVSVNKLDEDLTNFIESPGIGGVILMSNNYTTFEATKSFVSELKSHSEIPLIISTDQEGGKVQRLQALKDVKPTYIPSMYDLGKTNDINLAYDVGKVMAEELRTLGINVDFAPVADIYSNVNNTVIGMRSFGSEADLVSKMSTSLAKGLEDNKVIACYKHYPGHGDTATDSHVELPIINKTYEEMLNNELIPFKEAIKSGAHMIMVGHIALPEITGSKIPASLSHDLITDILKNDLGYNGLIITDALNMKGVTGHYNYEDIYTKAINAGVDLLLMPNNARDAINIIKKNVREERINESVKKILMFKYAYLNDDDFLDKSYLGSDDHLNIIKKIPLMEK